MKTLLLSLLLILAVAVGAERSLAARKWKQIADQRGFVAERSAIYLFGPSGVIRDSDGRELRRVELFDELLQHAVAKTPGLHFAPAR